MVIGQAIRAVTGGTSTYFSLWFPRAGSLMISGCDVIGLQEVSDFRITVQTKKREDSILTITPLTPSSSITSVGVTTFTVGGPIDGAGSEGLLELVRYKYVLTSNASQMAWMHFRMLAPTWETD